MGSNYTKVWHASSILIPANLDVDGLLNFKKNSNFLSLHHYSGTERKTGKWKDALLSVN
jgi:hypothetical protein